MNEEVLRIQRMVAEGKVSAEESVELLESIRRESAPPGAAPASADRDFGECPPPEPGGMQVRAVGQLTLGPSDISWSARIGLGLFLAGLVVAPIWAVWFSVGAAQARGDAFLTTVTVPEPAPFAILAGLLWLSALVLGFVGWRRASGKTAAIGSLCMLVLMAASLVGVLENLAGRAARSGVAAVGSREGGAPGAELPRAGRSSATPEWQRAVSRQIHETFLPQLDSLSTQELNRKVIATMGRTMESYTTNLRQRGEEVLAELEPIDLGASAGWTRVAVSEDLSTKFMAEFRRTPGVSQEGPSMLALGMWNPRRAAAAARSHVMAKTLGAETFGKRMLLEACAPPVVYAADPRPDYPVIVFDTGPERFVVTLRRTPGGCYLPEKAEWFRRADAPSHEPAEPSSSKAAPKTVPPPEAHRD